MASTLLEPVGDAIPHYSDEDRGQRLAFIVEFTPPELIAHRLPATYRLELIREDLHATALLTPLGLVVHPRRTDEEEAAT